MSDWMKEPTLRKVRNRGLQPCTYRNDEGLFNGWVVRTKRTGAVVVYLIAYGRELTIAGDDLRYLVVSRDDNVLPSPPSTGGE